MNSLQNWCNDDYAELLSGHFTENNLGQILCHNREQGRNQWNFTKILSYSRHSLKHHQTIFSFNKIKSTTIVMFWTFGVFSECAVLVYLNEFERHISALTSKHLAKPCIVCAVIFIPATLY